jgi:hypothetical protein
MNQAHKTMSAPTQNEATSETSTPSGCSGIRRISRFAAGELSPAHITARSPSFMMGVSSILRTRNFTTSGGFALRHRRLTTVFAAAFLIASGAAFAAGCGDAPKPAETKSDAAAAPAPAAPAKPAVPDDVQAGAQALLGTETTVLTFGDLAKNGKQQFLAANVVPKTTKNNNIPGTIITRAVIAQNDDGQWKEIFRCDEHLKNAKGFLGGTPLSDVTGWRVAYEQDPAKGLSLYLTPLRGVDDAAHSLPIGVQWNPQTKRYQSLDRTYEHFLLEQPVISGTPKSVLH